MIVPKALPPKYSARIACIAGTRAPQPTPAKIAKTISIQ